MKIPDRKIVVGNPARIVKDVTDEMLAWKTAGTRLYQALPAAMREGWTPCEPLREVPADRAPQTKMLLTWHETAAGLPRRGE
jgi:hypothetical protein